MSKRLGFTPTPIIEMVKSKTKLVWGFIPLGLSINSGRTKKGLTGFTPLERRRISEGKSSFLTGFTFIEVIVVLAIFSIVVLATYGVFHAGSMVYRRSKDLPVQERKVILALERLAQDLRGVCPEIGSEVEEWQFNGSARQITFVGFCNEGLCLYDYKFNPISGKFSLIQHMVDKQDEELEKIKLRDLIEGVEDFNFEFLGYDGQLREYFWEEEWQEKKELPIAVKATISYNDETYAKKIFILQ